MMGGMNTVIRTTSTFSTVFNVRQPLTLLAVVAAINLCVLPLVGANLRGDVDELAINRIPLPGATGSGPYDVANAWATAFGARYPEADMTLSSVGSGAAQKALWGDIDCEEKPVEAVCNNDVHKQTVWGLGDAPIKANVYEEHPTLEMQQIPACAGAIAIVYSDEDEEDTAPLTLTFDVLGGIFNRSIAYWDDPRIRQLNPKRTQWAHQQITVLVRQDSSGQTSIVTDAFHYNLPDTWPEEAVGKQPQWPLGNLILPTDTTTQEVCTGVSNDDGNFATTSQHYHADGKTGISKGMLRLPYSIGYMEIGLASGLTDFLAQAKVGRTVEAATRASAESLRVAMGGSADQFDEETLELNLARTETPVGGYPISGYAYWYIKRNATSYSSCYQAWLVCKFVEWAYTDPQAADLAEQNGWVVPPEQVSSLAIQRLQDVMCYDTEFDPPMLRSALSYTPLPYRVVPDDDQIPILFIVIPSAIASVLLILLMIEVRRRHSNGDQIWKISSSELTFSDPPEVIGRGSFGSVMLADYRGTRVAVKKAIPPDAAEEMPLDSAFVTTRPNVSIFGFVTGTSAKPGTRSSRLMSRKGFIEEMRVLSKLRHPCITTVMGAVLEKSKDPLLVMEHMENGSLYDILHNQTTVLDQDLLIPVLHDIIMGIRFLHSAIPPVVHGDLKAKNILVNKHFRAKVADFGLSSKKQKWGACGTPYWMAPELLRGETSNTTASDMYGFGMILYEMFSRKDPYEGEDRATVLAQVKNADISKRPPIPPKMPAEFRTMMRECLADEAEKRPSANEIDTRLQRIGPNTLMLSGSFVEPDDEKDSSVSLFDIFPKHIAQALKEGRRIEPEFKSCVSIFFSDVVGFTKISSNLEPQKVARLLDRLYRVFDDLSLKYDVFKVETIGDAYMAVTNLVKNQSTDHVKRIAMFAVEAVQAAGNVPVDPDDPTLGFVNLRAGFHSGPVVADVVGHRNPRYCLFGDSVNTASRMESHSEPGRIQCSRKSYSLLREQAPEIKIACRGVINVKGKGGMITYWVNEEPPEQAPRMTKGKRVRIAERSPTVESNEFRNYLRENMSISSRDSASILGEV